MNENNVAIAEAYYIAMREKNVMDMGKYLHPDVQFKGPPAEIKGKEEFKMCYWAHDDNLNMLSEDFSIYEDYWNQHGIKILELWEVTHEYDDEAECFGCTIMKLRWDFYLQRRRAIK